MNLVFTLGLLILTQFTGVQNDFKTEIKSGLNEGEKVIVSQVANGEQVGSMPRGPRMF